MQNDKVDVVFGSRLKSGSALAQGMPWWKYFSNRFLTSLENRMFGLSLSEYHTGYRAFRREVLETVNLALNSDGFIFDQEIVAQVVASRYRIAEIAVPTRYFPEASSASLTDSTVYGLRILSLLARYGLHRQGVWHSRAFDSLRGRYTRLAPAAPTPTRRPVDARRRPARLTIPALLPDHCAFLGPRSPKEARNGDGEHEETYRHGSHHPDRDRLGGVLRAGAAGERREEELD